MSIHTYSTLVTDSLPCLDYHKAQAVEYKQRILINAQI